MQGMFSGNNGTKLEVNKRKYLEITQISENQQMLK